MQVRSSMALLPFPHLLSHRLSTCNKLISLGVLQPPWLHSDHAFSICCLSLQVHDLPSAGHHSNYYCRLSKAFTTGYKMDLQDQTQDKTDMSIFNTMST